MVLRDNTILITGGTSGIGRALAEEFHRRGNRVIVAGRRQALLNEITAAYPGVRAVRLDVEDAQSIDAFAARVGDEFPDLNVLINNAGIARLEDLTADTIDVASSRSIIQTNIVGVLHMTAALLPLLRRQKRSTIITTSSGLAFVPRSDFPTYCASKAFLHSWLQSLRFQLRGIGVDVIELIPPYVQTALGGPSQETDPNAMSLADYVAEVMAILGGQESSPAEILVRRVESLRWAERKGEYERVFALLN